MTGVQTCALPISAAIAGADALDNHNQQEGQKDNAAHATSPAGESHAGRNTPAATTSFDFVEEQGGLSPDNAATLVVIDSRIPDYASLLDQLPAHAIVRVVDAQPVANGAPAAGEALTKTSAAAVPTTVEMMKFGVIKATIYQHPYRQGHNAVNKAFEYLVNGRMPDKEADIMKNEIKLFENL